MSGGLSADMGRVDCLGRAEQGDERLQIPKSLRAERARGLVRHPDSISPNWLRSSVMPAYELRRARGRMRSARTVSAASRRAAQVQGGRGDRFEREHMDAPLGRVDDGLEHACVFGCDAGLVGDEDDARGCRGKQGAQIWRRLGFETRRRLAIGAGGLDDLEPRLLGDRDGRVIPSLRNQHETSYRCRRPWSRDHTANVRGSVGVRLGGSGGAGSRGRDLLRPRKVRARQDTVVGNAHPPFDSVRVRGRGKVPQKANADGDAPRTGKGERVR